jgi:hypothetical protein
MPKLVAQLEIDRCPHCGVNSPNIAQLIQNQELTPRGDGPRRFWGVYSCARCASIIIAEAPGFGLEVSAIYPSNATVDEALPGEAKEYLGQAIETIHAPGGAIMLAASAVDAMLKEKGYVDGSLYHRIDQAQEGRVITPAMALWAHEIRLDANAQRHADKTITFPDEDDARRTVDFARAFGEYLFALPARIKRGIKAANPDATVPEEPNAQEPDTPGGAG